MVRSSNALANPLILKWAREERGFEIDFAAQRLGIRPEELAAFEEGIAQPTFAKLRAAARLYKRPTATFYLDNPPPAIKVPGFRRLPEHDGLPLSPELRLEIRRFNQKKRAAIEFAEFAPSYDWSYVGSIGLSDNPEEVGLQIRKMLSIDDDFPRGYDKSGAFAHWRSAIESLGTLVFLVTGVNLEEMRGLSDTESPFPLIAANRKDDPQPRTFTLLHEFCHVLLGDSSLCEIHHEHSGEKLPSSSHEVFCNHAAGAALVPGRLLLKEPTVVKHGISEKWSNAELTTLSKRFRVSREVILRRLLILKRTTDGFYNAVKANLGYPPRQKSGGGGGETAAERVYHTDGVLFSSIVLEAFHRGTISLIEVSNYLGLRVGDVEPFESVLEGKRR